MAFLSIAVIRPSFLNPILNVKGPKHSLVCRDVNSSGLVHTSFTGFPDFLARATQRGSLNMLWPAPKAPKQMLVTAVSRVDEVIE